MYPDIHTHVLPMCHVTYVLVTFFIIVTKAPQEKKGFFWLTLLGLL